jgi:outer membrane protein OmpA-like peptidoglycan-associated protein
MMRGGLKMAAICKLPRAVVLIAITIGALLLIGAAPMLATEQPTETQILEALKAKRLMRCPSASEASGCGRTTADQLAAKTPALDVEIFFERASARLDPKAISALAKLQETLHQPKRDGAAFLIAGHADASGGKQYNQRLSERRANAVMRVLVEKFKVPGDTFIMVGYGKMRPKNIADPFSAENRRVNIVATERR